MRRPRCGQGTLTARNSSSSQPTPIAEVDPAVRQPVEGGHLLGRVDGIALGEQHHGRAQADGRGVGGEEGQGVERLEQAGARRGRDPAVVGVGVGRGVLLEQHHVLAHPEAGEAALLGLAADAGQQLGRGRSAWRWGPRVRRAWNRFYLIGPTGRAGLAGRAGSGGEPTGATSGHGRSRSATQGQVQQELLLVVAADDLHADRGAVDRPHRDGDGRDGRTGWPGW